MSEDTRRLVTVAATLVSLVVLVMLLWRRHEVLRPTLLRASVVFWVEGEPVAAEDVGARRVEDRVWAGVLLQFRQGQGPVRTICPFPEVLWQGQHLKPEPVSTWPGKYGVLKAQWFTVEPAFFGWDHVDGGSADKLAYAEFAAGEMGSELQALVTHEAHNDDFFATPIPGNTLKGGLLRLKVKVGAYAEPEDLLPWASVASPGAKEVLRVPALWRVPSLPDGVNPRVSRAFRLAVFTFAANYWREGFPASPHALPPREMVANFVVMTPKAVAALAAVGDPLAEPWVPPLHLTARNGLWVADMNRPMRWGADVRAGDAVSWGERWAVLWNDDGDGLLDLEDRVLVAWHQPPRLVTLDDVRAVTATLDLHRVARGTS